MVLTDQHHAFAVDVQGPPDVGDHFDDLGFDLGRLGHLGDRDRDPEVIAVADEPHAVGELGPADRHGGEPDEQGVGVAFLVALGNEQAVDRPGGDAVFVIVAGGRGGAEQARKQVGRQEDFVADTRAVSLTRGDNLVEIESRVHRRVLPSVAVNELTGTPWASTPRRVTGESEATVDSGNSLPGQAVPEVLISLCGTTWVSAIWNSRRSV